MEEEGQVLETPKLLILQDLATQNVVHGPALPGNFFK